MSKFYTNIITIVPCGFISNGETPFEKMKHLFQCYSSFDRPFKNAFPVLSFSFKHVFSVLIRKPRMHEFII